MADTDKADDQAVLELSALGTETPLPMAYRHLFHAAADGMLIADPDRVTIDVNDAAVEILGIARDSIIGRRIDDVAAAGLPPPLDAMWASFHGDGPQTGAFTLRRPDGAERVVQYSATMNAANGCHITILRDITEHCRTDAALRESEAALRAVLDASPAMIAFLGADGTVLFVNESWRRFACETGCGDAGAWSARNLPWTAVPWAGPDAEDIRAAAACISEVLAGEREGCELTYSCAGPAERRWFKMLVRRAEGTRQAVVMHIDLTDQMIAEAALQRAREEAERASVAKTRFLAAASHDLRQPLQAAIVYHGLLAMQGSDPRTRDIVTRLGQSFEAQQAILDRLLDLSRLDAGIVTVERDDVPIRTILDRLVETFAPLAWAQGLDFRHVGCSARVHGDPKLIERILHNLLANAVDFTERGRVLLGCRRAGGSLRVVVADTGVGIPPGEIDAIFEEFYQIDNPARDRRKGLGLGLAIASRLARLLGHPLRVRSTPGRGTSFELVLPLADSEIGSEGAAGAHSRAGSDGALVAVIDDDPIVLEALAMSIETIGYRVAAGQSVEDVLRRLLRHGGRPQAIIADYRLGGGITGSDAIRILCQRFGAAIPSVLLTGDTSPARLKEAKESGFHLLHKPVRAEQLTELLGRMLSAAPPPARSVSGPAAGPPARAPAIEAIGGGRV